MFEVIRKKISSVLKLYSKNELKYENIKMCLIYLIIGFAWILFSDRAANIIDHLQDKDLVSEQQGSKPRTVYYKPAAEKPAPELPDNHQK